MKCWRINFILGGMNLQLYVFNPHVPSMKRTGCALWDLWGRFQTTAPIAPQYWWECFELSLEFCVLSAQGCFMWHLSIFSHHDIPARTVLSEWGLGLFRHRKWGGEKEILWQPQGNVDLPGLSYPQTSAGSDSRVRGRQRDTQQPGSWRAPSGLWAETVGSSKCLEPKKIALCWAGSWKARSAFPKMTSVTRLPTKVDIVVSWTLPWRKGWRFLFWV